MIRRPGATNTGFTLAETSIVLVIAGLLLAAASSLAISVFHSAAALQTDAKLAHVARALDNYAARNYRLPCPATPDSHGSAGANKGGPAPPFGYEAGSGPAGDALPANCGDKPAAWQGIVPFNTLNIPADWVKDAWGHYLTYAISPAFSQDVTQAALPVHARCRTENWFLPAMVYEDGSLDTAKTPPSPILVTDPDTGGPAHDLLLPKNERKARFCCPGEMAGTDLAIRDVHGEPQIAVPRQPEEDPGPLNPGPAPVYPVGYAPASVPYPNPVVANTQIPPEDRVTAAVYVLVSHGPNGYGAYTGQGAALRVSLAGATPYEKANAADGARTFYEIPKIDRAGEERKFDDVVLWRSQEMVMAAQGKSCALP